VGVTLGVWAFTPSHFPTLPWVCDVTPGLPLGPHSCHPFVLVASLKLGLRKEAQESHRMLPGMYEGVKEWILTLPRQLPLGRWSPDGLPNLQRAIIGVKIQCLEAFLYLLELKCIKWARIAHLHIWNTSYGQKKGRESNWHFDFRALKFENRPDSLVWRWPATYHWKVLNEGYNFA